MTDEHKKEAVYVDPDQPLLEPGPVALSNTIEPPKPGPIVNVPAPADIVGLSPLVQAAMSADFDPEKLEKMLDIQERWEENEAKKEYAKDMALCQKHMQPIAKNANNDQTSSRYAKHEAICIQIKPIYTKYGFSLSFHEGKAGTDNMVRILCDVNHRKGWSKQYYVDLPMDTTGIKGSVNKTQIHGKASTFSYGRRYLTLMIFDLATFDDDDGNAGGGYQTQYISEDQLGEIMAKLKEIEKHGIEFNQGFFIKAMKAESLGTIPANNFNNAINTLNARLKEAK